MKPKILIVDDKEQNLITLEEVLSDLDVEFIRALSGNEALAKTLDHDFAIALIDVQMPDMDGFETVEIMRQSRKTKHLPVIFVSAIYKEEYYHIKGIETGAVDFIAKPIIPEILIGKVRIFLDLYDHKKSMEEEIKRRKEADAKLKIINENLKEKNDELRASEERFRALVMTIPDIVYKVDVDGKFTFINKSVKRIGYEPEELINKHFSILFHPNSLSLFSRKEVLTKYSGEKTGQENSPKLFDERRVGERKTTGLEVKLKKKNDENLPSGYLQSQNGKYLSCEINSSGLYAVSQEEKQKVFIGTVGVIRDITQRKVLEKELQDTNKRLEGKVKQRTSELSRANESLQLEIGQKNQEKQFSDTLINCMPGIFYLFDPKGKIIRWNKNFETVSGYFTKQLKSMTLVDFFKGDDIQTIAMNVEKVFKEGWASVEANFVTRDDKSIPYLFTGTLVHLDGEEYLAGIGIDIAKRKKAEENLKNAYNKLEKQSALLVQTEKMSALGLMAAGIAHELNNPMMGILNFTQYCMKKTAMDDKRFEVLADIEYQTKRCIDIIQNLLTFSHTRETHNDKHINTQCIDIINKVIKLLSFRTTKHRVKIIQNFADNMPEIWTKQDQIQEVVLNLMTALLPI